MWLSSRPTSFRPVSPLSQRTSTIHSSHPSYAVRSSIRARAKTASLVTITSIAFGGTGILYALTKAKPLALEGFESGGSEYYEVDSFDHYYLPVSPPTMEQVNGLLRWTEHSQTYSSSILRVDQVQIPSNLPGEDEMFCLSGQDENGELLYLVASVYDGHAGGETASALQDHLITYLMREFHQNIEDPAVLNDSDHAIKKAFLDLDRHILDRAAEAIKGPTFLADALADTVAAYAGSCALVSYYNERSKLLKVACAGDSRAVLGRRSKAGQWEATALSADQTGYNKDEVTKLQAEHPDEPDMIKGGRLLGMAVTRAFGDARWKWSKELQEKARDRFFGPSLREPLLTPPYMTAEPVITTTLIKPDKGDFVIMASDGLWDRLTSEQAVDLVGRWIATHDTAKAAPAPDLSKTPPPEEPYKKRTNPKGHMAFTNAALVHSKNFIVIDDNAATHLARNALGGADEDMLRGMFTVEPPYSRKLRDDISIQVIFFGEDPNAIQTF